MQTRVADMSSSSSLVSRDSAVTVFSQLERRVTKTVLAALIRHQLVWATTVRLFIASLERIASMVYLSICRTTQTELRL